MVTAYSHGQVQELLWLPSVQLLGCYDLSCHKVLEILVVCPNFKFLLSPLQKVFLLFHPSDDGQHFLVVNLVVLFHCIEALGVESYWMPLPI